MFRWLKQRHISITASLVMVEIGAIGAYMLAGSFAHYAKIYRSSPLSEYVSFQIAQALFVFAVQSVIIIFLFIRWRGEQSVEPTVHELLAGSEHENLEFKSTLRWDVRTGKVNRGLEKAAMKTVAGFLNSQGGTLVLGVDDSKSMIGLHNDHATLAKSGQDGFENHFSNIFGSMIGPEFRQYVRLAHYRVGDKDCCVVRVKASPRPVYLRDDNDEEFFIRTGNATTSLKLSEVARYVQHRFGRQT